MRSVCWETVLANTVTAVDTEYIPLVLFQSSMLYAGYEKFLVEKCLQPSRPLRLSL
ncbi:hypothetical protein Mapa_015293 [Marchantia paleacea]|nr:hypothetical protein Mapa_015293 [Marchantia paleacea]